MLDPGEFWSAETCFWDNVWCNGFLWISFSPLGSYFWNYGTPKNNDVKVFCWLLEFSSLSLVAWKMKLFPFERMEFDILVIAIMLFRKKSLCNHSSKSYRCTVIWKVVRIIMPTKYKLKPSWWIIDFHKRLHWL